MNQVLFFGHLTLMISLVLGAIRLGKEALTVICCLFAVLANCFIMKQTMLFGLNVTCTDAYAVGSLLSLNLIQQYFGEKEAKQAANLSIMSLAIFALLAIIQILYTPSHFDTTHTSYTNILMQSPRIAGASLFTFFVIQRFDIAFFKLLRKHLSSWPIFLLITLSLIVTQTCDTFLFGYLGLFGVVHSVLEVSLMGLVIKFCAIFFMAPLSGLAKYVLGEKKDVA